MPPRTGSLSRTRSMPAYTYSYLSQYPCIRLWSMVSASASACTPGPGLASRRHTWVWSCVQSDRACSSRHAPSSTAHSTFHRHNMMLQATQRAQSSTTHMGTSYHQSHLAVEHVSPDTNNMHIYTSLVPITPFMPSLLLLTHTPSARTSHTHTAPQALPTWCG